MIASLTFVEETQASISPNVMNIFLYVLMLDFKTLSRRLFITKGLANECLKDL